MAAQSIEYSPGPLSYRFGGDLHLIAISDSSGVALCGRGAELDALREVGRRDPSLGRIYEGHVNAAQLVARYGTPEQQRETERDIRNGHTFAVWNTQDGDRVRITPVGDRYRLTGSKTWASGADTVTRALITAAWPDDTLQMCLVPLDRVSVDIDSSRWQPLGMEKSHSFSVCFDGVYLTHDDLIGKPSDYERQPWFFGGALRFLAVQTGVIERLMMESAAYLQDRGRHMDQFQQMRAAHTRIAVETCRLWLTAGADAWLRFDADETEANADNVIDVVDMARVVVERAALDVIEAIVRSVGARGLVEPLPFAHLVRDLQMYLRQPAPDAVLLRVGETTFRAAAAAASKTVIASSTGTIG